VGTCDGGRLSAASTAAIYLRARSRDSAERSNELRNALRVFTPFVVEREGRITGYM
jgi:hypothetical protein